MSTDYAVRKEEALKDLKKALWSAGAHLSMTDLRKFAEAEIIRIERAWSS